MKIKYDLFLIVKIYCFSIYKNIILNHVTYLRFSKKEKKMFWGVLWPYYSGTQSYLLTKTYINYYSITLIMNEFVYHVILV